MDVSRRPSSSDEEEEEFGSPTGTHRLSFALNSRGRSASEDHLGRREGTLAPHVSGLGGHFFPPGRSVQRRHNPAQPLGRARGGATQPARERGGGGRERAGRGRGASGRRAGSGEGAATRRSLQTCDHVLVTDCRRVREDGRFGEVFGAGGWIRCLRGGGERCGAVV